jgi:hypothetical protein
MGSNPSRAKGLRHIDIVMLLFVTTNALLLCDLEEENVKNIFLSERRGIVSSCHREDLIWVVRSNPDRVYIGR